MRGSPEPVAHLAPRRRPNTPGANLLDLDVPAIPWRGIVDVVSPFPHQDKSVILGQIGFLESFTVTFGPERFAVEPADVFNTRFGDGR